MQKKKAAYDLAKQAYEEAVRSAALAKAELPSVEAKIAQLEDKLKDSGADTGSSTPTNNNTVVVDAISKLFGESQIGQVLASLIQMGASIQQINDHDSIEQKRPRPGGLSR